MIILITFIVGFLAGWFSGFSAGQEEMRKRIQAWLQSRAQGPLVEEWRGVLKEMERAYRVFANYGERERQKQIRELWYEEHKNTGQ